MGDPKFPHKTYSTPRHPWEKERIESERQLLIKYGLKNKRELWKALAVLGSFRSQARELQARMRSQDPQAARQFQNLIARLNRLNILGPGASLDDVLSLTIDDVLSRRFQTVVYRRNLARTMKQARQMITHGHITMGGRRVTIPGVLVEGSLEDTIAYSEASPVASELHPIRQSLASQKEETVSSDKKEKPDETEEAEA
ncbi:MAG TPA: 30S ribosomal protein S4 [Thermoplasmataceae archaeon]|nr:30S ribosomal protein S4 [Thermoplasmatales archaeon AK]HLH85446.1 30S ribosomal protein S4 [Thermoplasmataceae archaeon]